LKTANAVLAHRTHVSCGGRLGARDKSWAIRLAQGLAVGWRAEREFTSAFAFSPTSGRQIRYPGIRQKSRHSITAR
jgi:hypothetical protein